MSSRSPVLLLTAAPLWACAREEPSSTRSEGAARLAPAAVLFEDVSARSGIDFVHRYGASGEKLLPETMGAGAVLADFDGDERLDLFLVDSGLWPGEASPAAGGCRLYRGLGDGRFEDVSAAWGADLDLYGMGASTADYDGDGDLDLYLTALADNVLLENRGGRFVDVTAVAGVAGGRWIDAEGRSQPEWSTASAWLDVDGDGDLDLFVANYVRWTRAQEIFTTIDGERKVFATPDRYIGLPCRLYVQDAEHRFQDRSAEAGLLEHPGRALGVALWDFDGDGLAEIVVANDTQPNFFFQNRSTAALPMLVERAAELAIAYDENGRARAGMGIDVGVLAASPEPWVAIGNFTGEAASLFRFQGEAFRSLGTSAGLVPASVPSLTFGLRFADWNLDGALDLLLVNGHIEPEIASYRPEQSYAQLPQLFLGRGDGTFLEASTLGPLGWGGPLVARGLCTGDLDGDGDQDLVITQSGGAPRVLLDRARERGGGHYLALALVGRTPNTRALGASVRLRAAGRTQWRAVQSGSSYLSQSQTDLCFGLGAADAVEELQVRWPDGHEQSYPVEAVDRRLVLRQP